MKTVKDFFDWKLNHAVSVENMYPKNEIIMSWKKRDVLYSFVGIYQIGLSIFYPKSFYRTDYQVRITDSRTVFGVDYLVEEVNGQCRYEQYKELNNIIEEKKFISAITKPGNIIPIWPGGNTDRGQRGYCFDIPDLYFGNWTKWFEALSNMFPEAALEEIVNETYSVGTVAFLEKVSDIDSYKHFLEHIVNIIENRTKQLISEI